MKVSRHTETALVALTQKMPVPASVIIDRLRKTEAPKNDTAIVVCQMTMSHGVPHLTSNGDTVVVIVREGVAKTAMLRRSYNQSFTADALRVDEVITWKKENTQLQADLAKSESQGVE